MQARAAYARGEAAFRTGDFDRALHEFETAYRAYPVPVVLRSIAQTEDRLGRVEAAVAHLRAYLDAAPADDPARAAVQADIAELLARPAVVVVHSQPSGAQVAVSGTDLTGRTPHHFEVAPGSYEFRLSMPGYDEVVVPIEASSAGRREVRVTFKQVAAPPQVAQGAGAEDNVAMWVAGGVGVAGLLTGSVLGFMALAENSDFDADPTARSADRGERLALFADVSFGVGVMALATGVVMFLTDDEPSSDSEAAAPGFDLAVAPLPGGGYARAAIRY